MLVRVHSECLTGDVFHSLRCDCGEQLEAALAMIEREGAGVLLYLSQEGRGIGLLNKLRAYKLQEEGLDTVDANLKLGLPADLRDYGIGAQILVDLGLSSIRILTNNPKKIHGLEGYGLSVADQVPIQSVPNPHNEEYLRTKRERIGHIAPPPGPAARRGADPRRAASGRRGRRGRGRRWLTRRPVLEQLRRARARALAEMRVRDLRRRPSTRTSPSGSLNGADEGFGEPGCAPAVGPDLRGAGRLRAAARGEAGAPNRAASPASPASAP